MVYLAYWFRICHPMLYTIYWGLCHLYIKINAYHPSSILQSPGPFRNHWWRSTGTFLCLPWQWGPPAEDHVTGTVSGCWPQWVSGSWPTWLSARGGPGWNSWRSQIRLLRLWLASGLCWPSRGLEVTKDKRTVVIIRFKI